MARIVVETRTLNKLISDLVKAEVQYSWIGSQPAEYHESIKQEVKNARKDIHEYLTPRPPETH